MGLCIDKSTRFLRALGYNVVRHPGEGLAPLDLVGWDHQSPVRLGRIEQLMVTSEGPTPAIEPGLSAADIDGKTTSKLPVSVGIDIFGSAIRALGGNLGVTAKYREAQLLEFSYHNVARDRTNPLDLGKFLRNNDVDWSNPILERYLLGKGRLFVVLEVVKSNKFGLTAFDKGKEEITVDAPGLQQLVGSEIANCAGVSDTLPSVACGHTKRPRSSRFTNRQAPWPSHQITFTRSPQRLS